MMRCGGALASFAARRAETAPGRASSINGAGKARRPNGRMLIGGRVTKEPTLEAKIKSSLSLVPASGFEPPTY